MRKNTLEGLYAERFCGEHSSQNILERPQYLDNIIDELGGVHRIHNGEDLFGPSEIWPAQIDGFAYLISKNHSHRKPDYDTLKKILLLESPKIISRQYNSEVEYRATIEKVFQGMLIGMKVGKLEEVAKRRIRKEKQNSGKIRWFFNKEKTKKSIADSLRPRIEQMRRNTPSYFHVATPIYSLVKTN